MRINKEPYQSGDMVQSTDMNNIVQAINSLYDVPMVELSVAHTNGVANNMAGITSLVAGGSSAASDGNNHLVLTPASSNWRSIPQVASLNSMTVESNVLASDLTNGNPVNINLVTAVMESVNSVNTGNKKTISMLSNGGVIPSGGARTAGILGTPAEIGDNGTLYGSVTGPVPIGAADGTESNYYFTYGIFIPASAATKTYKFRIYLTYE